MEGEKTEEEWCDIFSNFEYVEENNNNETTKEIEVKLNKELTQHYEDSFAFYHNQLNSPKYWCAPMVGASELAFRMMVRKLGTQLCTTPMIDAAGFVASKQYRNTIKFNHRDRPLIVQFNGNNAEILVKATRLVEKFCDAVELNIGCPQQCAKRGFFGAFLMNEEKLLQNIVTRVSNENKVPILCKTRIFIDQARSVKFAKLLQDAGATMITIHGRTRQQKRSGECLADWNQIKFIKSELKIPVFSNGNIRNFEDVEDCLEFTGCEGVMSALGILANPSIFSPSSSILHFPLPRNVNNNNDNNNNNNNGGNDGKENVDLGDDEDYDNEYAPDNVNNDDQNQKNILIDEDEKAFLEYKENNNQNNNQNIIINNDNEINGDKKEEIEKKYEFSSFYYARMYLAYAKRFEANYLQIHKHLTSILRNEFRNFSDQSRYLISINEETMKKEGHAGFYNVIEYLENQYENHPPSSLSFFDDDHEFCDPDSFTVE